MNLPTRPYCDQIVRWPESGRHILAHFDDNTIVVYQAYSTAIGEYAIRHRRFGGDFKYSRMSWIKPNFLWMMYRSNWGQSDDQQIVLGIRLRRSFFDGLLEQAVPSSFSDILDENQKGWKIALQQSDVRLQWDPDHLPAGHKCERRAIQLGLRGRALEYYGKRDIVEVIDMSEFVAEQRENIDHWKDGSLLTPVETVYWPASAAARSQDGLDSPDTAYQE